MVNPMSTRTILFFVWFYALGGGSAARAQSVPAADPELRGAEAAMARCSAAASEKRHAEALAEAKVAEAAFRGRLATRPNEVRALVGLARTLGACRIPSADLALMGELSAESIELLQRALEVEPTHWAARYTLALNYYRAPAFLGRSKDAAREFDRLITQQGERTTIPEFARPFEYRGMVWSRAGARDSAVAVWQRGARLFPSDTALRARLEGAGAALSTPPASDAPRAETTPTAPMTPDTPTTAGTPARIETVRVVASRTAAASVQATPSERRLTRSDVVMAAGGMADVLQAVQLQPGATRVGENAELFARGGDPSETPTFIEDRKSTRLNSSH